jgi:hypothetical protein
MDEGPVLAKARRAGMPHILKLNWTEFENAFERNAPDVDSYLELTTGEVFTITGGQPDTAERRARLAQNPERYLRIEPASSREQYRWMEQFVTTVEDERLRERLLIAIDGKGAFRRFKDVLLSYPGERERWFAMRSDLLHYRMKSWLEQMEIEAENVPPWGDVACPPEPVPVPVRRVTGTHDSPGEILRRQAKDVIDSLPAIELPVAIVFLEFLRDRGSPALLNPQVTLPGSDRSEPEPGSENEDACGGEHESPNSVDETPTVFPGGASS